MPRLLIVDDDEPFRLAMRNAFLRRGYEVTLAGSADEAKAALRSEGPDYAVVDLRMPGPSGEGDARNPPPEGEGRGPRRCVSPLPSRALSPWPARPRKASRLRRRRRALPCRWRSTSRRTATARCHST